MADYFSPTVIQQPIPVADMTPLERLVLSLIFDAEPDGEALYFHTYLGPSDAIGVSIDQLRRRSKRPPQSQHGEHLCRRAPRGCARR